MDIFILGNSKIYYYLCKMKNITDYKQYPEIQCIYKIFEQIENKMYIGSTFNLHQRMIRHLNTLKNNCHHSKKLQNSYNKYGIHIFKLEIIENCELFSSDELHKKETAYIKQYNSIKRGFNHILNSKKYRRFNQTNCALNNFKKARSFPVIGINFKTGEKTQFVSISEAAKHINDQTTNISKCLNKKLRYVKNFVFVHLKDYDENIDYTILPKRNYNHSLETKIKKGKSHYLAKKVYKYDLNWKLVKEYHSRNYCEEVNGMKKEFLRHRISKGTLIGGYWYTDNKK